MKTPSFQDWPDLNAADANWIEYNERGKYKGCHGSKAEDLLGSEEFTETPSPYAVWEITGYNRNGKASAVHRANQSSLGGALDYMKQDRILVHNRKEEMVNLFPFLEGHMEQIRQKARMALANYDDAHEAHIKLWLNQIFELTEV